MSTMSQMQTSCSVAWNPPRLIATPPKEGILTNLRASVYIPLLGGVREAGGGSNSSGFTLIEVLVALLVLTIVVSAALESQILSLTFERKAHMLQLFRFEIERIYSVAQRARSEQELIQLLTTSRLCRVKSEPIIMEEGTNKIILLKHELGCQDGQSFSTEFYNRPPGYDAVADRPAK